MTGSALAGAIFICSFLLSGIIADYKEAEKIPTELRAALENIWDEAILFKQEVSKFNLEDTRKRLRNIVTSFFEGVSHAKGHAALEDCLKSVDDLSPIFSQMQKLGLLPNFLVRLKGEQGVIRRNVLRVFHIQKTQFIPSAYILAESIVALIVFVLLFIKTEGSPESFVLFGFISYMFVYIVRLIRRIEQPFQEGDSSLDDVSLFLLHDLETKFDSKDTRFQKVGS
ncbi:hypothetical protein HGB07_05240 [Candidatus Roizmanbacteria bacterium]|nr:hypothetical protein [Candidatus Roizmanbacteria bacterium]